MGWLQIVLALVQLAPDILKMIVQLESIFGAGNGAAKKAIVMNAVTPGNKPDVVTSVGNFVDSTVNTLNNAGIFKKG